MYGKITPSTPLEEVSSIQTKGRVDEAPWFDSLVHLDYETAFILIVLIVSVRLVSTFLSIPSAWIIASLFGVSMVLVVGFKIAKQLLNSIQLNDKILCFSLTPLAGFGIIYIVWMSVASFSNLAPILTPIIVIIASLLPPKFQISKRAIVWLKGLKHIQQNGALVQYTLLILQVILSLLSLLIISQINATVWISSLFAYYQPFLFILIAAVVMLSVYLILSNSQIWFLSLLLLTLWSKSFMFAVGFVRFGGDDGDNMAIVQFLMDGGSAPLVDLTRNDWNWRFGSLASLCFQSNMAFICTIAGLDPSLAGGAIAISLSSLCWILGAFCISKAVLRHDFDVRISTILLAVFIAPAFWWQFRFDSNNLVQILIFPYLATALLLPKTRKGLVILLCASVAIFVAHFYALAIIVPVCLHFSWSYAGQPKPSSLLMNKSFIGLVALVGLLGIFMVTVPAFATLILQIFSLSDIIGPTARIPWSPGLYIASSVLVVQFMSRYFLLIIFLIVMLLISFAFRGQISKRLHDRFSVFLFICLFFLLEITFLDIFIQLPTVPAWRLWPIALSLLIIPTIPIFDILLKIKLRGNRYFLSLSPKTKQTLSAGIISILITFSLSFFTYPTEQALNLDTTTISEYELMSELLDKIDLNSSIIITEFSTWRHLMGIMKDWPPSTPTYYDRNQSYPAIWSNQYGMERVRAFTDMTYYANPGGIVSLLSESGVNDVFLIVFNRYEGPKSQTWHEGLPYIPNLKSWGEVFLEHDAGYVLRFRRQHLLVSRVPMSKWNRSAMGVLQFDCVIDDGILEIWGQFTGPFQSVSATRLLSDVNLTQRDYFVIRYSSNHESIPPILRIFFGLQNGTRVEMKPNAIPNTNVVGIIYNATIIDIDDIEYIEMKVDSSSDISEWVQADRYTYFIHDVFFTSWWSVL